MKRKSALFLLILMVNLYILGNPSPILTHSAAINDTKTDPTGDTRNAFVDIVNATVFRNETYFSFSVFTLEEAANTFLTEEKFLSSINTPHYGVFFPLLINDTIFRNQIKWDNQSWVASVWYYPPNQGHISPWTGSADQSGTQLSFQIPTSIFGNSSEFEWYAFIYYSLSSKDPS